MSRETNLAKQKILAKLQAEQGATLRYGKIVTFDEVPSKWRKSRLMQYMELKFGKPLEELICNSKTIYQLEAELRIDATTISKWRKLIAESKED